MGNHPYYEINARISVGDRWLALTPSQRAHYCFGGEHLEAVCKTTMFLF
jgi:hypothetical protein